MFKQIRNIISPKVFESLDDAVKNASYCKKLRIYFPRSSNESENFSSQGYKFLKLKKIKTLEIHGHVKIQKDFSLPNEIGDLTQLKKLVLLNLPLKEFPYWIKKLKNLRSLTVRGNEVKEIPGFIKEMENLKILRVENCELDNIPIELGRLKNLRELTFSDTKIPYFPIDHLPPKLKILGLGGPIFRYDRNELERLRRELPKTRIDSITDW